MGGSVRILNAYVNKPVGGWSATLPLPDYGRVGRNPPAMKASGTVAFQLPTTGLRRARRFPMEASHCEPQFCCL